jgi:hypothetical protein
MLWFGRWEVKLILDEVVPFGKLETAQLSQILRVRWPVLTRRSAVLVVWAKLKLERGSERS